MRLLQNITLLLFLFTGIYSTSGSMDVAANPVQGIAAVMVEGEHCTAADQLWILPGNFSLSFLNTTPHFFNGLVISLRNDHYSENFTPPPEVA